MDGAGSEYQEIEKGKAFLRVYALLIDAAERRSLVEYMDVARIMGIDKPSQHMARTTGLMLGAISDREHACGRPMLSAVAVSSTNRQPSKGFFLLAEQNGRIRANASPEEQKAFWEAERDRVFEEWAS
jgi:hypothetical protein